MTTAGVRREQQRQRTTPDLGSARRTQRAAPGHRARRTWTICGMGEPGARVFRRMANLDRPGSILINFASVVVCIRYLVSSLQGRPWPRVIG
jgi:hypothetical protein